MMSMIENQPTGGCRSGIPAASAVSVKPQRSGIGRPAVTGKRHPARGSQRMGLSPAGRLVRDFAMLAHSVDQLAEVIARPPHGGLQE